MKPSIRTNPIAIFVAALVLALAATVGVAPTSAFAKRGKAGKARKAGGKTGKAKGKTGKSAKSAASSDGRRVAVVPPVDAGPAAAPLAAKIATVLKAHQIQPVGGAPVKKVLAKDAPSMEGDWMKVAAKLKVDAVIESTMSKTGTTNRLEIVVRNGADGASAGRETFTAKGAPKKMVAVVGRQFWKKLGFAIEGTSGPENGGSALPVRDLASDGSGLSGGAKDDGQPGQGKSDPGEQTQASEREEEPKRADEVAVGGDDKPSAGEGGRENARDDQEGEEDEDGDAGARRARDKSNEEEDEAQGPNQGPRTAEVELDLRLLRRVWQYSPGNAANPYELKLVPLVGGQASWYFIKYLGVFARGEFTAYLKSGIFPTVTREMVIGALGRYPFSSGQISLSVAFFQHLFRLMDTPNPADTVRSTLTTPDVNYVGVRIGAGGRFFVTDRVLTGIEGAYRLVTNPGTGPNDVRSANYFPQATAGVAFDGGAFVGVKIFDFLEARVSADYRRYVFGKMTGKLSVAGASDDYLALNLGVLGVLGGK